MAGGKLCAKTRAGRTSGGGEVLELTYTARLREFSVIADLANQRTAVSVTGWDVAGKQAIRHEASESALASELNGDVSGPAVLEQAFGARKEQLSHTVPITAGEAEAAAEAVYRATARAIRHRPRSRRTTAEAARWLVRQAAEAGPLFSGKYYVTEVRQFSMPRGIRTEFAAERAGLGEALRGAVMVENPGADGR